MQIKKHKEACRLLSDIDKNPMQYLIIHYSCENFFDLVNSSPRIASISVRCLVNGQTDSFSIHINAERKGISLKEIKDHYDELELNMLEEYMKYLANHSNSFFIHWNMRDINYGFKAIEHRYMVLQNRQKNNVAPLQKIPDTCKIDLSMLLVKKYGDRYIEDPRMTKLIEKNQLNPRDFLTGKEEAEAFNRQEYIKLHLSTLSKTRVFDNFISLAIENKLKTNSSWIQTHGYSLQALWILANEKWYTAIILGFIGYLLGKLDSYILSFLNRLLTP